MPRNSLSRAEAHGRRCVSDPHVCERTGRQQSRSGLGGGLPHFHVHLVPSVDLPLWTVLIITCSSVPCRNF